MNKKFPYLSVLQVKYVFLKTSASNIASSQVKRWVLSYVFVSNPFRQKNPKETFKLSKNKRMSNSLYKYL